MDFVNGGGGGGGGGSSNSLKQLTVKLCWPCIYKKDKFKKIIVLGMTNHRSASGNDPVFLT